MIRADVSWALLAAGTALTALAAIGALRVRPLYTRLHMLTALTSIAGPLIGVSLVVANGPGITSALVVVIVVLLAVTGPVLAAAAARLAAQADGTIPSKSPP